MAYLKAAIAMTLYIL